MLHLCRFKSPIFVCDSSGKVTLPRATLLAEQTMREGVKNKGVLGGVGSLKITYLLYNILADV